MALYLLMNLVAVCLKYNLSFKSVVELLEFFGNCFPVFLRRIIGDKLLCGNKSEIVCKKLGNSESVLSIRYNRELLVDYTVLKEKIRKSLDEVVVIIFMLCYYILNLLLINSRELSDFPKELTCLESSDWKCAVVKIRNTELFLHLLY